MKKVLHLELNDVGGIETFLYNVYSCIDRSRYHFDFVTHKEHPAYEKEFMDMGARIFRVPSSKNVIGYMQAIKKILALGYDIVHINKNSAADIMPFIAVRKYSDALVIAHSHNTMPSINSRMYRYLHYLNRRNLYQLSDVHLACSTEAGKWLYGNNEFEFIPNGIDVQKFRFDENVRAECRNKMRLENEFTLIAVGRFSEQKNYERLIDIFSEIVKRKNDSVLLLVGDGELKEQVQEKVKGLALNDKVKFLGIREDVDKLLMAADCFLMTSLYEGLPVSVIEAQASGLPVFVSEAVSDEAKIVSGFYHFSLKDSAEEIADEILKRNKKSPDERRAFNNRVIHSDFNIDKTVNRLTEIYVGCNIYKNCKEQ